MPTNFFSTISKIQGGDPTKTGNGGKSIWDKPFEDEILPQLVHQGRGILSMANSGPNTNGSQLYVTFFEISYKKNNYKNHPMYIIQLHHIPFMSSFGQETYSFWQNRRRT